MEKDLYLDCLLQRITLHFLQLNFLCVKTLQIAHNNQWVSHTFLSTLKLFPFSHNKSPFWMDSLIFFEIIAYDQVFKRRLLTIICTFLRQFVNKWLIIVLVIAYSICFTCIPFGVRVVWLIMNVKSLSKKIHCFYHLVIFKW